MGVFARRKARQLGGIRGSGFNNVGDLRKHAAHVEFVRMISFSDILLCTNGRKKNDKDTKHACSAIHTYFFTRGVWHARLIRSRTCPHCHGDLGQPAPRPGQYMQIRDDDMPDVQERKKSFGSIRMSEESDVEGRPSRSKAPRPSTDDETANLV